MGAVEGKYMLSAVTRAVAAGVSDEIDVYNEIPVQGAKLPYVFVQQINMEQQPDNPRRHNRFYLFDVRYHPDEKTGSAYGETAAMVERLCACLWIIDTADQPVRARSIRTEIADGVLHVFAEYPVRVLVAPDDEPMMESLDIQEKIKEEE